MLTNRQIDIINAAINSPDKKLRIVSREEARECVTLSEHGYLDDHFEIIDGDLCIGVRPGKYASPLWRHPFLVQADGIEPSSSGPQPDALPLS